MTCETENMRLPMKQPMGTRGKFCCDLLTKEPADTNLQYIWLLSICLLCRSLILPLSPRPAWFCPVVLPPLGLPVPARSARRRRPTPPSDITISREQARANVVKKNPFPNAFRA
jgi:hypothetical protein